jgi:RNA polymerase sigma factor (sigma-70 family)
MAKKAHTLPPLTPEQQELFDDYVRQWGTPMRLVTMKFRNLLNRANALGIETEDIEQECWLRVSRGARTYDKLRHRRTKKRKASFASYVGRAILFVLTQMIEDRLTASKYLLDKSGYPIEPVRPDHLHFSGRTAIGRSYWEAVEGRDLVIIDKRLEIKLTDTLLKSLCPRDRTVIECRYGIGCEEMTLEDIGERLGITRERVRQLECRAIQRLRKEADRTCAVYE